MPIYFHRMCDSAGRVLQNEKLDVPNLQVAMAQANIRLRSLIGRVPEPAFDPDGRIEIADSEGHPIARIYCGEVRAACR